MEIHQISSQIYIMKDCVGSQSVLVVGEEKALVFDTCCGLEKLQSIIFSITHLPLIVLASHGHFDHIGGSYQFDQVYISNKDRSILEKYDEALLNNWLKEMSPTFDQTIDFGFPNWNQLVDINFDEFDLGNLKGNIVALPGHSLGSIGVFFPKLKLLLAGDALAPIMCLNFDNHGTLKQQLDTLYHVAALDFDGFITGHSLMVYSKDVIHQMIYCLENCRDQRFYQYQYPQPPYSTGWFYLDYHEDIPIGLIVENKDDIDL